MSFFARGARFAALTAGLESGAREQSLNSLRSAPERARFSIGSNRLIVMF